MSHFIPSREADAINWLKNFSGKIKPALLALGMPAELADAIQQLIAAYLADYDNAKLAKAQSRKATATKDGSSSTCFKGVQNLVAVMKKNPLFTASMGKDLQTDAVPEVLDKVNYKTIVAASLDGGGVRLRITRYGAEAVNVYSKLQSEASFSFVTRASRKTWTDKRPLDSPGIAQIRQYLIKGVEADEEFGHPSDIVTISFGG